MSIQYFDATQTKTGCRCDADLTQISTVIAAPRGMPRRMIRSQKIRHYRSSDGAHFWHWKDRQVEPT